MHTNATNTSLSGDKIRDNKQQTTNNKECNAVHFWWRENRRERCTDNIIGVIIIILNPSSSSSLSSYHQIVISNMLQLLDLCLDVSLSFLICLSSPASAACWPCTILILNISYSSTFQFILYDKLISSNCPLFKIMPYVGWMNTFPGNRDDIGRQDPRVSSISTHTPHHVLIVSQYI